MALKIIPNSERRNYVNNVTNATNTNTAPTDPMDPFERHIWNSILIWTNVTDNTSALAAKTTINLPILDRVKPETLQRWQAQLEANGYIVTKDTENFNVSIN